MRSGWWPWGEPVCALAGEDYALAAYHHAVESNYRLYSYGDRISILRNRG